MVFHHDILCQKEILHNPETIHQLWSLLVQSLDDLVGQISFVNQETLPGSLCLVTSGLPGVIASTDNRWISVTKVDELKSEKQVPRSNWAGFFDRKWTPPLSNLLATVVGGLAFDSVHFPNSIKIRNRASSAKSSPAITNPSTSLA